MLLWNGEASMAGQYQQACSVTSTHMEKEVVNDIDGMAMDPGPTNVRS